MSISAADGLCFLEDKRITIYKPFFIHVSMPEYLILNEHTEIRATIFNYLDENLIRKKKSFNIKKGLYIIFKRK